MVSATGAGPPGLFNTESLVLEKVGIHTLESHKRSGTAVACVNVIDIIRLPVVFCFLDPSGIVARCALLFYVLKLNAESCFNRNVTVEDSIVNYVTGLLCVELHHCVVRPHKNGDGFVEVIFFLKIVGSVKSFLCGGFGNGSLCFGCASAVGGFFSALRICARRKQTGHREQRHYKRNDSDKLFHIITSYYLNMQINFSS